MNRNSILSACEHVLKSAVDNVLTWYWFDIDDNVLIIKYLPLPSYSKNEMKQFKKTMEFLFLSAEDNDIFKTCKLRHLHMCMVM